MNILCAFLETSESLVSVQSQLCLGLLNGLLDFSHRLEVRGILLGAEAVEGYHVALPHVFQ